MISSSYCSRTTSTLKSSVTTDDQVLMSNNKNKLLLLVSQKTRGCRCEVSGPVMRDTPSDGKATASNEDDYDKDQLLHGHT